MFRIIGVILWPIITLVIIMIALVALVRVETASYRYTNLQDLPQRPVALVLGAQVLGEKLSPILADRVDGAIALYKAGKVKKLLMSGDNGSQYYNEPVSMQQYAIAKGIPASDITLDYAGFSTYDSCYRAKEIFGVKQAIVVTQAYHLSRAVYTCRQLGIDAVGYSLPDWEKYPDLRWPYTVRETLAVTKAYWSLEVSHPLPIYLGKYEGIQ